MAVTATCRLHPHGAAVSEMREMSEMLEMSEMSEMSERVIHTQQIHVVLVLGLVHLTKISVLIAVTP
jgi:hypothetical protein